MINKGRVANSVNFQMLCLVSFTNLKSIIQDGWSFMIRPSGKSFPKYLQKLWWRRPRSASPIPAFTQSPRAAAVLGTGHPGVSALHSPPSEGAGRRILVSPERLAPEGRGRPLPTLDLSFLLSN